MDMDFNGNPKKCLTCCKSMCYNEENGSEEDKIYMIKNAMIVSICLLLVSCSLISKEAALGSFTESAIVETDEASLSLAIDQMIVDATNGQEPHMEIAVTPKVVIRDGNEANIVLTVFNSYPFLMMYGAKSYPIYRWDEASGAWIGDPDNFGLTTDEGLGFVGSQEIPITLDLDGFYAEDGVYMITFKAQECGNPENQFVETVTFQIKRE